MMSNRRQNILSILHMCSFLAITVFIAFAQAAPKTDFYFFGGGGEGTNAQNMFDFGLDGSLKLAREKKWNSVFQADIEHPSTKAKIANLQASESAKIEDFTAAAFEERMKTLTAQIESGKSPKQVLVVIDTHGIPSATENAIAVSDGRANMREPLRKLVEAAEAKGVKLGLVLMNCYSGNIRADFGRLANTCIVSGSSNDRIADNLFASMLWQIGVSPNLEDAFLQTRRVMKLGWTQPGINTTPGVKADRDLSIYRNYSFHPADEFSAAADRMCENTPQKLEHVLKLAKTVKVKTDNSWFTFWKASGSAAAHKLVQGIRNRGQWLDAAAERPETGYWGIDYADCMVKASVRPPESVDCENLYNDNFDSELSKIKLAIKQVQTDPAAYFKSPELIARRKKIEASGFNDEPNPKQELVNLRSREEVYERRLRNPAFVAARKEISRYKAMMKDWEDKRRPDYQAQEKEITEQERKLYDAFYDHYSKLEGTNACREFKLK